MRPARQLLLRGALVALVGSVAGVGSSTGATPPPTDPPAQSGANTANASGRRWPMPIPAGCTVPDLADVVFLGTVVDADFQTARYRIDQIRAGDLEPFAYGGLVDVRYGDETRFLSEGTQYLIGASELISAPVLTSRVRVTEPLFAGDEVIGVSESDVACPQLEQPVRTLDTDGTAVDSAVFGPLADAKGDLLRAILIPVAVAVAIVFGLVSLRWILTGMGKGVGSVVATATQTREARSARRKDW